MPGHRKRRQFKQTDAFTRGMVIGLKRAGWNVGATRVTSARMDRRILRQAVAAPQATCTAILQHVQDTLDHSISTRTISRRLVANGLHSCRPLRRLPLTPPNRRQRLEWCRARSTWMTEWHRVVFSDESRFCLSSDSRRVRVWRRRGERSNPTAIVERPTVRQRGIMVWGAIAYDSRSPLLRIQGTMTAQRYVDDVLRPVTLPYLQGVPNALYQQDNARPHTARISQQALQDVQMLPWPPYSPDLSPIEHVWDIIGRRLHALPQPRSEDELWQMVEREWRAIPQDAIRTLIDSLPRRVAACIAIEDISLDSLWISWNKVGSGLTKAISQKPWSPVCGEGRKMTSIDINFDGPSKAEQKPARHGEKAQQCAELSKKEDLQKKASNLFNKNQGYANPPAGGHHANPATPTDFVTASFSEAAAQANRSWADLAEDQGPGEDDNFTVVKSKKRRRDSPGSPTAATSSGTRGAGATRRPRSSTGWAPRAEEVRTTQAHIAEARARQASSTEDHCVYVERSPELEPYHYIRAIDRMFGSTREVFQVTKMNGHFLVGLANKSMAERLVNEGLEVEGTLHRAFPFRKRAERITVGNLPFFVGDAAVISALSSFGRVTSIAPKLMKAGPYVYNDGRREAFIILREGMTIERLPTRLDISIKGEAWPAYLSSGIRCSRANHRSWTGRTNLSYQHPTSDCAQAASAAICSASTSGVPQFNHGGLRRASREPSCAPSTCCTPAITTSAFGLTFGGHASGPSTSDPCSVPANTWESRACGPNTGRGDVHRGGDLCVLHVIGKNATRVDLDAFIEALPSVSFAKTDALGLGREEVLDLLSSRTKAQRKGPLLSPPQCDALVGLIGQILDLKPGHTSNLYKHLHPHCLHLGLMGQYHPPPHGDTTTPDMATPLPPPSAQMEVDPIDKRCKELQLLTFELMKEFNPKPLPQFYSFELDLVEAVLYPEDREGFLGRFSPGDKKVLAQILDKLSTRDLDSLTLRGLSELRAALPS
ncbi:hypothetical protein LAZ67_6002559 [Cordylochernes scorpioides]|uniref:Transposase n=1 Tax=Cordylochernes scorpioides TaxID=51811 RepID=A0ABY6KPT9_9ARAC|nr:hypothetical protein LAZ67_6002559 [Cordylochernes scorpioides]